MRGAATDAGHMRRLIVTLLAATALIVGACQQAAPVLTDPNAILAAAASTTASATSVHIDLSADGPIELDPFGTGAGASINLRGTTASADVDLAANELRATFSSPNLMGIAGEVIVVDQTAYLKSTLTGSNYLKTTIPEPSGSSPAPSAAALSGIADLLARADLHPIKGDDVPCAGGTCYTVTINLTAEQLAAIGGPATGGAIPSAPTIPGVQLPDLSGSTAELKILVEQATTRLSGIDAVLHLGDLGDPHVTVTFTKWNEPVTIAAPPADQVAPAP
jgi:LppX_LprAFG lipoprotein